MNYVAGIISTPKPRDEIVESRNAEIKWIDSMNIEEELFEYSNSRICNLIIIHDNKSPPGRPPYRAAEYMLMLEDYGAVAATCRIGRSLPPYPDSFAVCADREIKNDSVPYVDMIRHIKTNCAQFTIKIIIKNAAFAVNTELIYTGNDGICIFDEYLDQKNVFGIIHVESIGCETIDWILCGEIHEFYIDYNNCRANNCGYVRKVKC